MTELELLKEIPVTQLKQYVVWFLTKYYKITGEVYVPPEVPTVTHINGVDYIDLTAKVRTRDNSDLVQVHRNGVTFYLPKSKVYVTMPLKTSGKESSSSDSVYDFNDGPVPKLKREEISELIEVLQIGVSSLGKEFNLKPMPDEPLASNYVDAIGRITTAYNARRILPVLVSLTAPFLNSEGELGLPDVLINDYDCGTAHTYRRELEWAIGENYKVVMITIPGRDDGAIIPLANDAILLATGASKSRINRDYKVMRYVEGLRAFVPAMPTKRTSASKVLIESVIQLLKAHQYTKFNKKYLGE